MFQQKTPYDDTKTVEDLKAAGLSGVRSPIVEQVARQENGAPVPAALDFERFISWGLSHYPSEHVMVVVWGHGQGWAPAQESGAAEPLSSVQHPGQFSGRHFGGLAFSDSTHAFLDIPSLHWALRSASQEGLNGRPIDLYASDACLMQMAEVATELWDSARFITGSSEVENYLGIPYRRMMYEINTGRFAGEREKRGVAGSPAENDEPLLLARMLPKLFRASLNQNGLHRRLVPDAIKTVTMSSISSEELAGSLGPALSGLAQALQIYLAEDPMRAIAVTQAVRTAPSFMGGSQDLGGVLTLLRQAVTSERKPEAPDLSDAAQAVLRACDQASQALDRTVVAYALGTRYSDSEKQLYLLGIRALAIWLPASQKDFASRIGDFSSSLFYRSIGESWVGWLQTLFGH